MSIQKMTDIEKLRSMKLMAMQQVKAELMGKKRKDHVDIGGLGLEILKIDLRISELKRGE